MSVDRIKQEIDEEIGQALASGAVDRFPDDILLWGYDAARDYVFALTAIDDLILSSIQRYCHQAKYNR